MTALAEPGLQESRPMDHEQAFAKAFLHPAKRARIAQFLGNRRRRQEVLDLLDRDLPYIRGLGREVDGELDFPDELEKLLQGKGAGPTCHLIVDGDKADGRELPLGEALRLVCLLGGGAVLSCIPGRLAYYRPVFPGRGVLLER